MRHNTPRTEARQPGRRRKQRYPEGGTSKTWAKAPKRTIRGGGEATLGREQTNKNRTIIQGLSKFAPVPHSAFAKRHYPGTAANGTCHSFVNFLSYCPEGHDLAILRNPRSYIQKCWKATRAFNISMQRSQVCQKAAGARDSLAGFLAFTGKINQSHHKLSGKDDLFLDKLNNEQRPNIWWIQIKEGEP